MDPLPPVQAQPTGLDDTPDGATNVPSNNVLLPSEQNWESSEPLDDNFYKRIHADKDDTRRDKRSPGQRQGLDMESPPLPPPLQAQPTITLPGDSLLDALVPDHVNDCRPFPLQVAQGETYLPSGQRITISTTTMSNAISSMDARVPTSADALPKPAESATVPCYHRRCCWVVGAVLLTLGAILGGFCGSGKCHTNPEAADPFFVRNGTDPHTGVDIVTLIDAMSNYSHLSAFTQALNSTGLVNELCLFDCNYTVFAPTDAAFASLDVNLEKFLTPQWIMHLKRIVMNHITKQRIMSRDLTVGRTMHMLSRETVSVVHADDGAIALMSAGTNVSFVTQTDYEADNGVVHLVDALLWPPFLDLIGLADTYVGRQLSILLDLAYQLNLNESLSAIEVFTVFAPIDAAFEALGDQKLSSLRNNNDYLRAVLSNHVVFEVIPSMGISAGGQSYATLGGQVAHISYTDNGSLMVNDANVLIADALANNGIVHVIDKVLLEPYSPTNTTQ
jgi:uncharacterized surface protein with fasciclin (FAS1) repeats